MPLSEEYLKSVSESQLKDRAYTPYELAEHEKRSIEEIRRCIKLKKYNDIDTVKDSLEYIETIANKMNEAIQNEKKENKTTWELESDLNDLKKLFEQLNTTLSDIEAQTANNIQKKQKLHFKR